MLKHLVLALFATTALAEEFNYPTPHETVETVAGPRATGYLGHDPRAPKAKYKEISVRADDLPESFDWYDHVSMNPIRNQKNCGSCYSFAISRAFESALAVQANKFGVDLSEQEIVSCDQGSYACSGGFMETAGYVVKHGQGLEKDFPYVAKSVRCKKIPVAEKAMSYTLIGDGKRKPTVNEMKAALIKYGPLFVTVSAGGSGWNGKTGKVTGCRNRSTNHMVTITAFNKDGEWTIDNSWGENWGEHGRSKIKFGCDMVGSEAGFFEVAAVD